MTEGPGQAGSTGGGRVLRGPLPMPFGHYTLVERLGVGGMAEVFLATQEGAGGFSKQVVVKRLLPHLQANAQFVQMFLREARVASSLSHPNVVQIFELGQEAEGDLYLAMEYVPGLTVRAAAEKCWSADRDFPVEVACRIAYDAALGLDHLHTLTDRDGRSLALVHRDIAPDNLMVSFAGITKVLDFGIAKPSSAGPKLTETGDLKGKVPFMSPEQVSGEPLDGRSDLFSLGVSLYWLLTGVRPFDRESDLLTLNAILSDDAPPPRQARPDLPDALDAVVQRLLVKDRAQRLGSAAELAEALGPHLPRSFEAVPAFLEEIRDVPVDPDKVTTRGRLFTSTEVLPAPEPTPPPPAGPPVARFVPDDETDLLTVALDQRRRNRRRAAFLGAALAAALGAAAGFVLVADDPVADASVGASSPSGAVGEAAGPPLPLADPAAPPDLPPADPGGPGAGPPPGGSAAVDEDVAPPPPRDRGRRRGRPARSAPEARAEPARAPSSSSFRLKVVGPARISWRTLDGKPLGRGTGEHALPGAVDEVVAVDTWLQGRSRVPVVGGTARYESLGKGKVQFRVLPWAEVFIGKERIDRTPFSPYPLVEGEYEGRLVHEGEQKEVRFTVRAGETAQVKHSF